MERLTGEARDRVRATSLWVVVAATVIGVLVGLWVIYVGFLQVTPVPSEVVSVSADGREVTVELTHTSCQEPATVVVEESADGVVLTARVDERVPLRERSCTAGVVSQETVVLDRPLGDRELRTLRP